MTVAPVTTDVGAADEYSVILPKTATLLGVAAAACFSLECVIPLFTFDRLIAPPGPPAWPGTGLSEHMLTADIVRDVWLAWRRGVTPPQQLDYGELVTDGDLDRRELRAALAAEFLPFIEASAAIPGQTAGESPAPLSYLLEAAPRQDLAPCFGLKPEVLQRVASGGRVTLEEAHLLTCLLDTNVATILAANPPFDEDLVIEVSRPRWRSHLRDLADEHHTTEDEERLRLADAVAAQVDERTSNQPRPGKVGSPWAEVVAAQLGRELGR